MKILMVNDYKDKIGGAEIYMYNLSSELKKRGHIIELFTSAISQEEYYHKLYNSTKLDSIKKIFNFKSYFKMKKYIKKFSPDIVHINGMFNELTPSILLAIRNIPIIYTIHNNQIISPLSISESKSGIPCKMKVCYGCKNCIGIMGTTYEYIKRKFHKILLRNITLFITPSEYMRNIVMCAGFNPITVMPNGIKLLKYSDIKNFNKLLYIGRLTRDKGIDYLLYAMPDVIKKFPDVLLQIVGDGDDKKYFMELSYKLNIINNVKFINSIPSSAIEKYYAESTIVIVPSIYPDNFPTVCLEAMSAGRPIIGTNIGGIPELIVNNHTGYLVKPNNYQELTKYIIKLLNNKKIISKMSKNAINKSNYYNINTYINNLELKYANLI